MNEYELRQEAYDRARALPPSELQAFARERGEKTSPHIILGIPDTVPAARIAVVLALDILVKQGTCIVSETPYDGRSILIRSQDEAKEQNEYLADWQRSSLDMMLSRGACFVSGDKKKLARLSRALAGKDDEGFLRRVRQRDFRLATEFAQLTRQYERVIGVYGGAHVVSPIFDRILENVPHARYVYRL